MSLRVSERWVPWIEADLAGLAMGEAYSYELAPVLDPTNGPAIAVMIFTPGALLGTNIQTVGILPNPAGVTAEVMTKVVTGLIANLNGERARQLAVPPSTNGQRHT